MLAPSGKKTESLVDCFHDLELTFSVVTETWFHQCERLQRWKTDLHGEHGLSTIDRMRKKNGQSNPGGGVSTVYNKNKIKLKEHKIARGRFELVAATGKIPNNTRPFYIIGAYLSTRLRAKSYHEFMSCLSYIILRIKTDVTNPYIVIAGDFNRRKLAEAIGDYPDITTVTTGATRGAAILDEVATSFNDELVGMATHDPLTTQDGRQSDHAVISFEYELKHNHQFKWVR